MSRLLNEFTLVSGFVVTQSMGQTSVTGGVGFSTKHGNIWADTVKLMAICTASTGTVVGTMNLKQKWESDTVWYYSSGLISGDTATISSSKPLPTSVGFPVYYKPGFSLGISAMNAPVCMELMDPFIAGDAGTSSKTFTIKIQLWSWYK